ncbi:hypothetical protein DC522_01245 [Microvirga sp. KLBC 81]|uniref:hypothetical protein n=1 Tax=Microvirga sp. KLBC 81 TaxID=1862707 RepID=UPI000D52313E|nr:hypothetical protein [Microvirga sp. KLBC 81]PVE26417.1 hypothetical protein DC522_01245 [Microvirga sp. KLBC 81]
MTIPTRNGTQETELQYQWENSPISEPMQRSAGFLFLMELSYISCSSARFTTTQGLACRLICRVQEPERIHNGCNDIPDPLKRVFCMPEERHEAEADTILAQITGTQDRETSPQARRLLAEALERAERRGREIFARSKESSG